MQYTIKKIPEKINIKITLPSSKSMSNRLLLMSALSEGKIKIENLSSSDDTQTMIKLLDSDDSVKDAGHAGTTMRFLTAYYALKGINVKLTGTERMKNRPVRILVEKLRELGANISYLEKDGFPPLKIDKSSLEGGEIEINSGVSSQYISALMMTGPYMKNGLKIKLTGDTISSSYIEMTAGLMREAGISVKWKENIIEIGKKNYHSTSFRVEPDWSSASYWFSFAGLHGNSQIILKDLQKESYQGDAVITSIFDKLGVRSEFSDQGLHLSQSPDYTNSFEFDFRNNPDMVQTVIPYCVARGIQFHFSGCRTLRIKETDRVIALHNELKKFGVKLKFSEDGEYISWDGKSTPEWSRPVTINTYDDHRIAMGFAPLAIKNSQLIIRDPKVVTKSYPSFWADMKKAGFHISAD